MTIEMPVGTRIRIIFVRGQGQFNIATVYIDNALMLMLSLPIFYHIEELYCLTLIALKKEGIKIGDHYWPVDS